MNFVLSRSRRAITKSKSFPLVQPNDLAPEILAQILDFATDPDSSIFPNQTRTLELCTVCSLWRSVILTHPRFWTYLHISIRGTTRATDRNSVISARLVAHFERWFSRAGDLHLELYIDFGEGRLFEPTEIFHEYLVRQNSRWRLLRFEGMLSAPLQTLLGVASQASKQKPCWPNLQHFIIENSRMSRGTASGYPISLNNGTEGGAVYSLQQSAPMLQNCALVSPLTQSPFSYLLHYPCASLTSFQTDGLGLYINYASSFITFLLSLTPNLRSLHIRFLVPWKVVGLDGPSHSTTWVTGAVRHEKLEELRLQDLYYREGESGFTPFGYLQLPSLRLLYLSTSTWDNRIFYQPAELGTLSPILVPFIRGSQCELVHLRLRHFATSSDDLMRVLAQIGPTLKTLELEDMVERGSEDGLVWRLSAEWGARFLASLRDARKLGQSILPELETFNFV